MSFFPEPLFKGSEMVKDKKNKTTTNGRRKMREKKRE